MKNDSQLQQEVLAELKWDAAVDAAQIGVEVKDGVVTLSGHVATYGEKWDAERAVQRVSGVKALAVEIDVNLTSLHQRTDADIALAARNVLDWLAHLPQGMVKVMVEKGWVTLSGEVDWHFQRRAATDAVRHLMGVTGVSDDIAIKPQLSLSAVQSDIEAALQRRAKRDAQKIQVQVAGDQVTLAGTVQSWGEREMAVRSAWSTPGVRTVVDNILVAY